MSMWTHITACMSVETGIVAKKPELKKQVKEYLDKAPKITGSEGPADVFVNIQSGYSFYTSRNMCPHTHNITSYFTNPCTPFCVLSRALSWLALFNST